MNTIHIRQAGISVPTLLFENLSLTINSHDHFGLVAGNGGGKTSLLRCIAGLAELTTGTISCSRGMRLSFVEQKVPSDLLNLTLIEAIRQALPCAEQDDGLWRVEVVLDELEAPSELRQKMICELSGGWQRLALIARAWVGEPDTLLLDEPTNHLDLNKIKLLERWITTSMRQIPIIISSHDRSFLDACTTHTLFLRPGISKIYHHPYSKARHLLHEDDRADVDKLEREMKEAERLRQSAKELKNIGINSRSDSAQKKSKQMAQRAAEIEQKFKPPHKEYSGDIKLNSCETHARVLLSFDDIVVCKPDGSALFRTGRLKIFQGERIIILGHNGAGKSCFINMINRVVQESENIEGVRRHPTLVLGYADQQMSQLPDHDTPFDFLTSKFQLGDQKIRTLLAGSGFPVMQQTRLIGEFSLGQKARLGLLVLRLIQPNFYLLDEPTNHMDISGQEKLEEEILAQDATCIIVSHDRSFVKAIGTRYLLIYRGKLVESERSKIF
jgi:ATPase subunit of ABC transporter with duplicated ATPase domains